MTTINLNRSEIQSRYDRVLFAEGLIEQLPETHEGRNTWLMNYGVRDKAKKLRSDNNVGWDDHTQSAETINGDVIEGTTTRSAVVAAINVGDRFRAKVHTITDNEIPVEHGAVGTVIQVFANSVFLKFEKCGDVFNNETIRKDFEKLPAEHPLAELTNVIKYWSSPWTPGVWWNEFDDAPRLFRLFDSATNYGKGRWVKIDKPPFTPRPDPLEEKAKEISKFLFFDENREVLEKLIKQHFADWEPKE